VIDPEATPADPPSDRQLAGAGEATGADTDAEADALPLDLTQHYRMKASDFDKNKRYPWPAAPRGSQTFAGVPLEIGGALLLWGQRNAEMGLAFPEQITGIPLERKFEFLYICHGAFFEGPAGTPTCDVVFHYDDGTSASDTLECGGDARDWFLIGDGMVGPSNPRSTLAWKGEGLAGDRPQAIRFCLTAVANPHPDKEVTALDLVSSKSQAAACILAITTGKAGLMQRDQETQPAAEVDE
jgi:hypothetical protein